jgi:excisionase family DNA binding protein
MSRRYISIAEAAEYLKISDRTVRRLIADGELTGGCIPGVRRPLRPVVQRDGAVAVHPGACWWVLVHDPISVVVGAWDVAAVE